MSSTLATAWLVCRFCVVWLCTVGASSSLAQSTVSEISNVQIKRTHKDLMVSADIKFELPSSIEEAMYKGVSLTFVSDIEMAKERWYWLDKTVAVASRQTRISYQALTRRWRVLPWSEASIGSGLGVQLPQTYETLTEALTVAQRIYNWRITPQVEPDNGVYVAVLRYRLDMSQLPKPLQIGLLGQGDWSISASIRHRFQLLEESAP